MIINIESLGNEMSYALCYDKRRMKNNSRARIFKRRFNFL